MMATTVYIQAPLLRAIHDRLLAEHGGTPGVRNCELLKSICVVRTTDEPASALPLLAAHFIAAILRNRPFVDGNKRTAIVAHDTFLRLNNVQPTADDATLCDAIDGLDTGRLQPQEFARRVSCDLPAGK